MARALSAFLQQQADLAHDRRVPEPTKSFIRQVQGAEKEMDRALGLVRSAFLTADEAWSEVRDLLTELLLLEQNRDLGHLPAGVARELIAAKRNDLRQALDWAEDRASKLRAELHAAAERRSA